MMPQMPQLATAVGRPPMTGGVTTPNPAAAPRLAAPAVNTGRVGRPPMPGGGAPRRMSLASKFSGQPGAAAPAGMGAAAAGVSKWASKLAGGGAKPSPQIAQGAVGGWNAAPDLVSNAVKMMKAGSELGPQHRGPLNQLLANTDSVQRGPFQAPAGREGFASKFGGSIA